jgi:hypothetical protein
MRRHHRILPIALLAIVGLLALPSMPAGAAGRATRTFHTHAVPPRAGTGSHITSPVPPLTQGYLETTQVTGQFSYAPGSVQTPVDPSGVGSSLVIQMGTELAGFGPGTAKLVITSGSSSPLQVGSDYSGADCVTILPGGSSDTISGTVEIDQLTEVGSVVTSAAVQGFCGPADGFSMYMAMAYNAVPTTPHQGYYSYEANGLVSGFGNDSYLNYLGDLSAFPLNQPVVGMAQTADGGGYWMVAADGGIFAYGDAQFYGSMGGSHLNEPIVGMAETRDGKGYWLVAADGGIFAFGDATFHGSMGGQLLNRPIVGMAPAPNGNGYWLVAADGGIFAFGDAPFYGSTGNIQLSKPVVGMAPTLDGKGYWFVASDGGVFAYGDATFHGSAGNLALAQPIVGMAIASDGEGYWLVAEDGGIFGYNAPYYGSIPGSGGSVTDVVGLSTLPGLSV